jgi:hypothetical protein
MSFNEYWKEKAAKRRKTWVARDKRYASRHNKLEYIRREVFQELDERKLETYLKPHYTEKNPIVCWKSDKFSFSEASLREALISEGADMTYFKMEQSKRPIHGKSDVEEEKARRRSSDLFPGTLDYTIYWWLEKIYELSSEVETVLLTYKGVTMMINRYSKSNVPFGYYEVIPCHHLACSALKLQETTFHTLNIATLLMEMAAEWELRNEELNYHAKRLKLRALEAVVCDRIDFELWDDKKIETKVKEYFKKDYSLKEMYQAILRPWIIGVEKFMEAITTRDISDGALEFHYHSSQGFEDFVEQKLRPYLNSQNLGDFHMFIPAHDNHQVIIEYQGWQVSMHCSDYRVVDFYPNVFDPKFIMQSYCDDRLHVHFCVFTISAVAEYLRRMPAINEKIDRVVKLVNMKYNELKNKTEK